MLGRFQNSSVPVLILRIHSVPVSSGSAKSTTFGSGSKGFGFSVLTVLSFYPISAKVLMNFRDLINLIFPLNQINVKIAWF